MFSNHFLCYTIVFQLAAGSNILIFNPIFGFSHVKFISQMANIIADHGHNITLLQPYHLALKNTEGLVKNKNIEILNYYPDHYEELLKSETETFPAFWDSHLMNNPILQAFSMPKVLGETFKETATQILQDEELLKTLEDKKFDIVISETFELTGTYLAHILNVPCIPVMSAVRFININELFGQPSILGYIPNLGSKPAPGAGFLDRLNDVFRIYLYRKMMDRMFDYQFKFIETALKRPIPNWKDLVTQSPIYITNSNPYLDFACPTTATIVHAGGITMNLEKKKNVSLLPEDYEKMLNERDSTVLISFGSVIRSYQMPESFRRGLIQMFKSLPDVTFIWKYEQDDKEFQARLPTNVHLKKWVPQPSLLADKRVKVFVTHGGLGSTMEVAYSGKPALMVPIFGDQNHNADMLARHGGAIAYDKFDLQDGKKLTRTLRAIISNPKYHKNAQELSSVLTSQPIDPTTNFINHLEFAIKFPNLRSQVPDINRVGFVAHYYLDVIIFFSLITLAISYFIFLVLSKYSGRVVLRKTKSD